MTVHLTSFPTVILLYWISVIGSQTGLVDGSGAWDYLQSGPTEWLKNYPECGRHNQSPINLDVNAVKKDGNLEEILFVDYDDFPPNKTWQLLNNGHTAQLKADFQCPPRLQRGSLNAKYELVQVHFHWSNEDFRGSEHHVDGRQYSLEMHLVHKRVDPPTEANANDDPYKLSKQLAVVGVFFKLGNESNEQLQPITDALEKVENASSSVDIRLPFFTLQSLLPSNRDYFRYSGSLTTPPCDAIVQWSVLRQHVSISLNQLEAFRKLKAHSVDGKLRSETGDNTTVDYIIHNIRPVQPIGDRDVLLFTARRGEVRTYLGAVDPRTVGSGGGATASVGYFLLLVNLSMAYMMFYLV